MELEAVEVNKVKVEIIKLYFSSYSGNFSISEKAISIFSNEVSNSSGDKFSNIIFK